MKKSIFSLATLALFVQLLSSGCCKETPNDLQYARVTRVVITEFPATKPNGTPWDPNNSAADIYFRFEKNAGTGVTTEVYEYPTETLAANPFESNSFSITASDLFLLAGRSYKFYLIDEDDLSPRKTTTEEIGLINFTISGTNSQDKPDNPILLSGGGIKAEIHVEYVY